MIKSALSNLRREITSPQGTTTGALQDLEAIAICMNDRLEKLENVVSKEEMPKTKELDDIVAKMYKDVERLKLAHSYYNKLVGVTEQELAGYAPPAPPPTTPYPTPNPDPSMGEPMQGFPVGKAMAAMKKSYLISIDVSASPKNMPFSAALEFLKAGRKIRRAGAKDDFFVLADPGSDKVNYVSNEGIQRCFPIESIAWSGCLSADWEVVEEPKQP